MKKITIVCLAFIFGLCMAVSGFAADRDAIQENVDSIVQDINEGKKAEIVDPNAYDPYVFIMEESGVLVVHPELTGKDLSEIAEPVYEALIQSTPEGTWVDYEWKGAQKHSYVRTTDGGLIVGSGYTE